MTDVEVSETIKAPASAVYALVADLPRMGEWSPENTGGKWLGGASGPAVDARFRGTNRAGWRFWTTTVTVRAADAGRRFAFDVDVAGLAISTWTYTFADAEGGCVVTESWADRRPSWMRTLSVPVMGVRDRAGHNRRNMQETLQRLKAAAER
jgi:Polyketide cyclase / dehydrase and lipid transport